MKRRLSRASSLVVPALLQIAVLGAPRAAAAQSAKDAPLPVGVSPETRSSTKAPSPPEAVEGAGGQTPDNTRSGTTPTGLAAGMGPTVKDSASEPTPLSASPSGEAPEAGDGRRAVRSPAKGVDIPFLPRARAGKPLVWDESFRRFELGDWIATGIDGALALAFAIVKPLPKPFKGGVLFDESVRNSLRLKSIDARGVARDTSDVLISLQVVGPFLVDSLVTAWWYRGSKDVAQEMALIDLETLSVTAAIQGGMATFTGRERPYVRTCGGELPSDSLDCESNSRYRSFFSGHTSLSFTSASLVCWHHLQFDLFADKTLDALSCASAMTAAAATGALRIMSDQHYATDVLTGALAGTGIGFAVPYLLHRHHGARPGTSRGAADFTLHLVPTGTGASAVGTF